MTVAATLQGILLLHTGDFPIAVSLALMGGRSLETLCHSPKDVDDLAKNNDGTKNKGKPRTKREEFCTISEIFKFIALSQITFTEAIM